MPHPPARTVPRLLLVTALLFGLLGLTVLVAEFGRLSGLTATVCPSNPQTRWLDSAGQPVALLRPHRFVCLEEASPPDAILLARFESALVPAVIPNTERIPLVLARLLTGPRVAPSHLDSLLPRRLLLGLRALLIELTVPGRRQLLLIMGRLGRPGGVVVGLKAHAQALHGVRPGELKEAQLVDLVRLTLAPHRTSRASRQKARRTLARWAASRRAAPPVRAVRAFTRMCRDAFRSETEAPVQARTVRTTLDRDRQAKLQADLDRFVSSAEVTAVEHECYFAREACRIEAVALVARRRDGSLLAVADSTGGARNLAGNSRRQISSAIKPFLYAYALERGKVSPDSVLVDGPVRVPTREGTTYSPSNVTGLFRGPVGLSDALAHSINTVAVRLLQQVGTAGFRDHLGDVFAIAEARLHGEPSLALGTIDVSPMEVLRAYLTLANQGVVTPPYCLADQSTSPARRAFTGWFGRKHPVRGDRLYARKTVREIDAMLRRVLRSGTMASAAQRYRHLRAAAKTGSSPRDSWVVGYTRKKVLLVWVGRDSPAPSLPTGFATPLWLRIARSLERPAVH